MSNSIGMMFSFIFLALFIIFSGEIIVYQTQSAKALSITSNLAIQIEKYGYSETEFYGNLEISYFDEVTVDSKKDDDNNLTTYSIKAIKSYHSFSKFFSFMDQDIQCQIQVSVKE